MIIYDFFGSINTLIPNQINRIVKLTTFFLTAFIIQVSGHVNAQKVTLNLKNKTLGTVLESIKKQTNYNVLYPSKLNQIGKLISIQADQRELVDVLNSCFADQPFSYIIEEKTIIVKEVPLHSQTDNKRLIINTTDIEQERSIRGRVTDSQGRPMVQATIAVKGTNLKTSTNDKGEFELKDASIGVKLIIQYLGYQTKELTANKSYVDIQLQEIIAEIEEIDVVNTGYQTLHKERSAGAIAKVNMDVVANRTTSMNILQSLDGQVPGLVVNNVPNRNQLLIRGLSTTGGSTGTGTTAQPLYVVDGLALPPTSNDNLPDIILNLNPQDVQNIEVLKDATAASIWGARAANGVIVITTKSGKFNSKTRINYNAFVNFQGKPKLDYIPMLNSEQFVQTGIEQFNIGHNSWNTVSALNGGGIQPLQIILYNLERGLITQEQANVSLDSLSRIDNRQQIKDLFYRNAMLSNQTVSISGGGDKYSYYGSASYTNTVDNVPGNKNKNYKVNVRQDYQVNNFLRFHLITDLTTSKGSSKRNLNVASDFIPYQLFRDLDGNNLSVPFLTYQSDSVLRSSEARSRISLDYNPLDEFERGNTQSDNLLARINGGFKLDLFKGLKFEGTYGYIKGKNKIRDFESLQSYTVRKEIVQFTVAANPTVAPKYYLPTNGGRLTTINGDQHKWDIRNQLLYDNRFGKHEVMALLGQEAQENFNTITQSRVRGFDETLLTSGSVDFATIAAPVMNTVLPTISTLASSMINDSFLTNETTTRFTSYYANGSYTYDRRYTINASWRNDQSNLFGKDKSAQNKPIWSVGGKWNISNESFMRSVPSVQQLSLRLTYGITGNSPNVGVASSQDITGPTGSAFFPGSIGMRVITPGNPNLSWERTATTNIGIDFSILNNRLSANIDIYQKKTTDLLGLVYPNSLTGFTSVVGNQGDITNRGIEANILSQNIVGRDFSWSTNWIFAYNKNTVDKISMTTPITTGAQRLFSSVAEGFPAYTLFAYKYGGLDNTGAPLVILADGTTTNARNITKPEDVIYTGTMQPVWNGGLTNNFQYKDFRLSANMVYNMGHKMRRQRFLNYGQLLTTNVHIDYMNRWQQAGDEAHTDIPGQINSSTNEVNYFIYGDNNVLSSSFLKLRDITLFYNLPKEIASKIKAQGITLRAQISNVLLWADNKYGIDPEFQDLVAPTNQNTISFGINLSL